MSARAGLLGNGAVRRGQSYFSGITMAIVLSLRIMAGRRRQPSGEGAEDETDCLTSSSSVEEGALSTSGSRAFGFVAIRKSSQTNPR